MSIIYICSTTHFIFCMENRFEKMNTSIELSSVDDNPTDTLLNELSRSYSKKIDIKKIITLIENGADLYKKDSHGQTSLSYIVHGSMRNGNLAIIKYCTEKNINWQIPCYEEKSPYQMVKLAAEKYSRLAGLTKARCVLDYFNELEASQLSCRNSK